MTYEFYSYETINLPVVTGDTYYLIFDHSVSGDPSEDNTYLYSGYVLAGNAIINLNEILAQYVKPREISFSLQTYIQSDSNMRKRFYVYSTTPEEDWETFRSDYIIIDYMWDYDIKYGNDNIHLQYRSDPILPMIDNRQFIMNTRRSISFDYQENVHIRLDGETIGQFSMFGWTIYNYIRNASTLNVNEPGHILSIGTQNYEIITDGCFRYCLYYLNQWGGWDTMLFRGKEMQTDNISRLSYKKDYVVNSLDFHKVDYMTKINEQWTLNTSYIDDIQSSKMINVIGSNRLYLHDLVINKIMPVNITNTKCEHKTYKNQGRKMSVYTLEVSSSQEKYRI
jgi:hypothetical protein